ncbi:phosphoenolpyruvate--protein phosphotransferase [Conexibacter sp. W3-3-2]|uniref:phosphoenolpyruvate--protein phosphotransferase n=1 Tax=Conexibacter sp. W3-3-2 TaxID=2675227 RepID=UPI0012B76E4C|nr:phosphoenolpyruvate--protein phosphotransferase [Conexibacter sp. W3-3-2]MTD46005.1 phosphoenolpyruvate--protein phosphotransferase [Conexibacter sp. W3-3-2]
MASLEHHGLGVSAGIAVGPVARLAPGPQLPAHDAPVADTAAEARRATAALEAVAADLEARAATAGGEAADVLTAQALMARDPMLASGIADRVTGGRDAPHAVDAALAEHRAALVALGGYMAERAADLDDLRTRAIAHLLGVPMPGVPDPGHPFVLVATDLAPADTATLDRDRVVAIVTERGGPTDHTAILAKSLGIPAVVACAAAAGLRDGDELLVDGGVGRIVVGPDRAQVADAQRAAQELAARRAGSHGPGRTADGHPVRLLVNIGGPADVDSAGVPGAQGVGLFRTEFLFLDRATAPTRDEQEALYREVFTAFAGRRVIVRTLDVGADKPLAYVDQPDEANPALGVRGLRLARRDPGLLTEQLLAIAAAAAGTDAEVGVMAPMVATAAEARDFAAVAREHGIDRVGVMVEVPAAALCATEILQHVDFVSLGTNDLAQYTLGADRLAGELADLLDPWQPAVLRLVAMVGEAGLAHDKPVGVCGEAASDPELALVLTGLGVSSLSMAAACLPDVRATLAAHTLEQCRALAQLALAAPSAPDARAAVHAAVRGEGAAVASG